MTTDHNPFQSPEAVSQLRSGEAWPIVPFQSGHQRAMITIWLLAILAIIYVAGIAIIGTEYASAVQRADGTYVLTRAGAEAAEGRRMMSYAEIMIAVGAIIAFSMWTHRAQPQFAPGIGWPRLAIHARLGGRLVLRAVGKSCDAVLRGGRDLAGKRSRAKAYSFEVGGKVTSPLVLCWWLAYIVRSVVPFVVTMGIVGVVTYKVVSQHGDPQRVTHEISKYLPDMFLLGMAE